MKSFLKKNMSSIIIIGVIAIIGIILAIAIYITANKEEEKFSVNQDNLIQYVGSDETVTIESNIKTIGESVFSSKTKLTTVKFEKKSKLEGIGRSAFEGCTGLKTVELPGTLKTIGRNAFKDCTSLESIVIPEGVTTIEAYAFKNCSKLVSITLPSTLTTLEDGVFEGCSSLVEIKSSSNLVKVENNTLFFNTKLVKYLVSGNAASYTVPAFVTEIEAYAFQNGETIKQMHVGKNVLKIGTAAFIGCENIESITVPFVGLGDVYGDGTYVGGVFANLFSTGMAALPESLVKVEILGGHEISTVAFRNCRYLQEIILPNTIKYIGVNAFMGCSGLTKIVIPESVTYIAPNAFQGCANVLIKVQGNAEGFEPTWMGNVSADRIEYAK